MCRGTHFGDQVCPGQVVKEALRDILMDFARAAYLTQPPHKEEAEALSMLIQEEELLRHISSPHDRSGYGFTQARWELGDVEGNSACATCLQILLTKGPCNPLP